MQLKLIDWALEWTDDGTNGIHLYIRERGRERQRERQSLVDEIHADSRDYNPSTCILGILNNNIKPQRLFVNH